MKVLVVVTHLLGTGHLARALTLGQAFCAAGDDVTLITGGRPVPHFEGGNIHLIQLPPVHVKGTDFTALRKDDGGFANRDYMVARRDQLLATLVDVAPDLLVTELFPFGRRSLRDEFGALLGMARGMETPPLVLASVRDILAPPSKPGKVEFAEEQIETFYDGVLVHADPEIVTLDHSWPVSDTLATRLHYTGFVASDPPIEQPRKTSTILVSAGGSDVGDSIFEASMDAATLAPHEDWLLLIGGTVERRKWFANQAPPNVSVEAPRRDFREMLTSASASISMCGYNTVLDILQTGVPSVVVPFDDGGEVEQGLRATALSHLDGVAVLRDSYLSGASLSRALDAVKRAPSRSPRHDGMDGAAQSVKIAHRLRVGQVKR